MPTKIGDVVVDTGEQDEKKSRAKKIRYFGVSYLTPPSADIGRRFDVVAFSAVAHDAAYVIGGVIQRRFQFHCRHPENCHAKHKIAPRQSKQNEKQKKKKD